jgi:15-cis-phytoene synthase
MGSVLLEYNNTSFSISRLITRCYSTSFFWASLFFEKEVRKAIFNIYGFVRFADEIVDTFQGFDQQALLDCFTEDLDRALAEGVSLNPVLHSFAFTVREYDIDSEHIRTFLRSMQYDLSKGRYVTPTEIGEYIHGSAEVVGLMCLKVFCKGDPEMYRRLEPHAISLGAAFQKVNFLRDLYDDMERLDRRYFPDLQNTPFDESVKEKIIHQISDDFHSARSGVGLLPRRARLAVTIATLYYITLLNKLKRIPADQIAFKRIRIGNHIKLLLIPKAMVISRFNLWKTKQ